MHRDVFYITYIVDNDLSRVYGLLGALILIPRLCHLIRRKNICLIYLGNGKYTSKIAVESPFWIQLSSCSVAVHSHSPAAVSISGKEFQFHP